MGRLRQKQPFAGEISKFLVVGRGEGGRWRGAKSLLPVADFHGHELQILVKMYTTGIKFYKNSLEKLTNFVVEILMTIFSF